MKDMDQTKKQLLDEIADLRQKIKGFEKCAPKRSEWGLSKQPGDDLYRLLVEQAGEAILVIQNEKICYANAKASEITGFSGQELCNRPFISLIHPDDRRRVSSDAIRDRHPARTSEPFTCRIRGKHNDIRWLETKLLDTTDLGHPFILCYLSDVTERKLTEEALRDSEGKYRLLVDHAPAGIYEIDLATGQATPIGTPSGQVTALSFAQIPNGEITIDDIIDFLLDHEDIVGIGPGKSSKNRFKAFMNMVYSTSDYIDVADYDGACRQMESMFNKCDGLPKPPDFISGNTDTMETLTGMLIDLRSSMGCE